MSNIVEIRPIEVHSRIINSVDVADHVVKALGAQNKRHVALYLRNKLIEKNIGIPKDKNFEEIQPPYFQSKEDFYYEFEISFSEKDFDILVKISLASEVDKNKNYQGCTMHILDAILKLKEVK